MRAFLDRLSVIALPRLVAHVRGERALEFLHAITSQDVASLKPGSGALACHLDAKGRVLAELRVLVTPDGEVFLDADEAGRDGIEHMARIAPLSGCEFVIEPWTRLAARGPGAHDALAALGPLPSSANDVTRSNGALIVRDSWALDGFDILTQSHTDLGIPEAALPEWERARIETGRPTFGVDILTQNHTDLDIPEASLSEWERARIETGRPTFGIDITPDSLINETPLLDRAVSFNKGCFPGQETVARVRNLGQARWKMVTLRTQDAIEPGPLAEGGRITSVARTPDDSVAIATVRADAAHVVVNGVDVPVQPIG